MGGINPCRNTVPTPINWQQVHNLVDLEVNFELCHLDKRLLRQVVDGRSDDDGGGVLQVRRHDGAEMKGGELREPFTEIGMHWYT